MKFSHGSKIFDKKLFTVHDFINVKPNGTAKTTRTIRYPRYLTKISITVYPP